jgi:hypothetical protein
MRCFIAIVLLVFGWAVARGEESVSAELLPSLKEAALMQLIESHNPKDYFTVAMEYEPRQKTFVAPSEDFIKKMLRIKDMDGGWFVRRELLSIPVEQDVPSPNGSYPGVIKRGTDKRVSVYTVRSAKWRSNDEAVVVWSNGSGQLSGSVGSLLFRRTEEGWFFVKTLSTGRS